MDEPEANLNPELYPLVANILLELQKNGVQIFVATHSYNFAKYLEIRRSEKEQVRFHNLYKNENQVVVPSSADRMDDLEQNHIMMQTMPFWTKSSDSEVGRMSKILVEENNLYELDCTAALWATDQIHEEYHRAKTNLKDADF